MNPWAILAIEPTREEREIKRAYTRKLREHPPETDPDGFKALRSAYESALFFARLGSEAVPTRATSPDPSPDPTPGREIDDRAPWTPPPPTIARPLRADIPPAWLPEAKALLRRIRDDFPDHSKRQFRTYWESILDIPLLWNLDAKGWLGWNLCEFLGQTARESPGPDFDVHIGQDAWIFLDGTFGWLESESQLYAAFGEGIANAVLDPIRAAKGLQRSVDLAIANTRAAELADLGKRSFIPRGFGLMMSLALIVISNLIHTCSEDTQPVHHYRAVTPAPYRDRPDFFPKPSPGSHPQVFLNPHSLDLETAPPPPSDIH